MRRKISTLRSACFRARCCPSPSKLSAPAYGRGAKTLSTTKPRLDCPHAHHDALEFPDGEIVLLTYLMEGQQAAVVQLPAAAVGSKAPQRAVYVWLGGQRRAREHPGRVEAGAGAPA